MKRWLLIGSLALNAALVGIVGEYAFVFRQEVIANYVRTFGTVRVLMLGDSHTQWGSWNISMGRLDVEKIAMAGYTSEQVLRLSNGVANFPDARQCFVLAGSNDIPLSTYNRTNTLANLTAIADKLRGYHITPVFNTVPYMAGNVRFNTEADTLNAEIKEMCRVKHIAVIDLNIMVASNHELAQGLRQDSMHLNATGYRIWSDAVKQMLRATDSLSGNQQ